MIYNLLKSQWCTDSFRAYVESLPSEYSFYIRVMGGVRIDQPTFHERFVTYVGIQYMDTSRRLLIPISDDFPHIMKAFDHFMKPIADKPQPKGNVRRVNQCRMKSDLEAIVGIDNNISTTSDVEFCLNQYSTEDKARIINFLQSIDENSPEVYIKININCASHEQLTSLADTLLEVNVISVEANSNKVVDEW